MAILVFFVLHWQLSVMMQSFFLHRYGAHRQFTMSKGWERFFHLSTWMLQGSSYLNPRGYAIMHRMHHAFSDTEKDPHSPIQTPNVFTMMWQTKVLYRNICKRRIAVEPRFEGGYPEWPALDNAWLTSYPASITWGALYTLYYIEFATHWWMFALLPVQWIIGPVHGAIVNYFGHKLGYRNYASDDHSRNALFVDFVTAGELFQNNHHKWGQSPSFAVRWFEVDPTYQFMRVLSWLRIIDMSRSQRARWDGRAPNRSEKAPLVLPSPSPMDGE